MTAHFGKLHSYPTQPVIEANIVIALNGVKSIIDYNIYVQAEPNLKLQEVKYLGLIAYRGLISVDKYQSGARVKTGNLERGRN